MKKNKPIGCRTLHFPKQVGTTWICMHCDEIIDAPEDNKCKHHWKNLEFPTQRCAKCGIIIN